jgi:hypothetical protein
MLAAVIGSMSQPGAIAAQREPAPLDLAAITLTPGDLESAGSEGYLLSSTAPLALDDEAAYLGDTLNQDAEEIAAALLRAEFDGGYYLSLVLPADEDEPAGTPARLVGVTVYAFGDDEGAAGVYDLVSDEGAVDDAEDVEGDEELGDESDLTRLSGDEDLAYGLPYDDLELELVHDRLYLNVTISDYEGEPAKIGEVEELGARLLERAEAALDGDAPGLSPLPIRLETEDPTTFQAYYLLDGETIRLESDTDEGYEARRDRYDEIGAESVLIHQEHIPWAESDSEGNLVFYNTLVRFEDEDAAGEYMEGLVERLAENPANADAREIEDAPRLGDESVAVTLFRETDGEEWILNEVFVRVGDVVSLTWIELPGSGPDGPEVGADPLIELAEAQAECLEDGGCVDPVPVPDDLLEDAEE